MGMSGQALAHSNHTQSSPEAEREVHAGNGKDEPPTPVVAAMDPPAANAGGEQQPSGQEEEEDRSNLMTACQPVKQEGASPTTEVGGKKRRFCKIEGCDKVVKSQGLCQRHGAKPRRCRVEGCIKQAQGTHLGMCKRHWKELQNPMADGGPMPADMPLAAPPEPHGSSVYDTVLPASIGYKPPSSHKNGLFPAGPPPPGIQLMPLVQFLADGVAEDKPFGWHRDSERLARGIMPVKSVGAHLEPWERQLVMVEILLLSGGTPYANFSHLAHAWGKPMRFHLSLAQSICERRGDLQRAQSSSRSSGSLPNGSSPKK